MKLITAFLLLITPLIAQISPAIIPLPAEITTGADSLTLGSSFAINSSKINQPEAKKLEHIIKTNWRTNGHGKTIITLLDSNQLLTQHGHEAYTLTIAKNSINITAASNTGHFYAIQTLRQLAHTSNRFTTLPNLTITDYPRFTYRGLMLDEASRLMGKKYIKALLRSMAAHKLNRFHWKLTDAQNWRIEIKSSPDLIKSADTAPHYTQKDIQEIVTHAKSLHIEILPEINLPSHFSITREASYEKIEKIISEISTLFPYPYIHIGGKNFEQESQQGSPELREYLKQHNQKTTTQLQKTFTLRLKKILHEHNKTLIGWNEITHEAKLSNNTTIMAWTNTQAGINTAREGHPTIMTPAEHCLFSTKIPATTTRQAYDWNPVFPDQLNPDQQKNILGIQCELQPEPEAPHPWQLASATAEVAWTPQQKRNYKNFLNRQKTISQHQNEQP